MLLSVFGPLAGAAEGASLTLAWDPSASTGVQGYVVSYGATAGSYSTEVDVGLTTQYTITIPDNGTYHVAVQAYNSAKLRSAFSKEVIATTTGGRLLGVFSFWLYNASDGSVATWQMDGLQLFDGSMLTPGNVGDTHWHAQASGDLNGDGKPDLLWEHDDGRIAVWLMDGTKMISSVMLPQVADPAWRAVAIVDINHDGQNDIIWQNLTSGQIAAWLMTGTRLTDGAVIATNPDPNWKLVGSADFDGDGMMDLLWQHRDGWLALWRMNLLRIVDGSMLQPSQVSDVNWKIVAVADIDGDGHPDLVWRNVADGSLALWFMNGSTLRDGMVMNAKVPGPNWVVLGR